MGTYKSVVDFEEGRRFLADFGLAEQCKCCGRRWVALAQRPDSHRSNGPYVIVDIANGAEVGTSDKLLEWSPPVRRPERAQRLPQSARRVG